MLEKTAEGQKLQREAQKQPCAGRANAAKSDGVWGDCEKHMLPRAAVCDENCYKRPCARRLRKGDCCRR